MIADRIDRRDSQAITNRTVRRATAALHHDVVFPAKINDVPDDQKITGESQSLDEAQFLLELLLHRGADRRVTLLCAKECDRAQERIHVVPVGNRKGWEFVTDVLQGKFEAFRQAPRVFDRVQAIGKESAHFSVAL